jgi:hypothetical protein|tara:strand:- start:723 stop:1031 length:309 start_codon:yes stop_codon:yes gene_type:complete
MEIYCKYKPLLESAIMHSKALCVDSKDAVVHIKRLPPQFSQKGLIEYPRTIGKRTYIDIFIKMDDERFTTLAHEMMHVKQVLTNGKIDENEAYLYEKTYEMP